MQVQNRLGELVAEKARLDKRRYSYRDIAEATGLSVNTVKAWMNNEATRFDSPVIVKLCEWLACELSDLLILHDSAALI